MEVRIMEMVYADHIYMLYVDDDDDTCILTNIIG